MEGFKPAIIEKLFYNNAMRILKLEKAVEAAAQAAERLASQTETSGE
jgi:hypothetical protein